MPGVRTERGPKESIVYSFDGIQSGLALSDLSDLGHAKSLTVAAWVWMRKAPAHAGQLVFRGDDRLGNDPFQLVTWADGTVHFGITDEGNEGEEVGAVLPVGRWTHVVGSIDDRTSMIRLYLDGVLIQQKRTKLRPMVELDSATPGIGVGNIQNPGFGPHNQPFDGKLADVRIYPAAVAPKDAGYQPEGWNMPFKCVIEEGK